MARDRVEVNGAVVESLAQGARVGGRILQCGAVKICREGSGCAYADVWVSQNTNSRVTAVGGCKARRDTLSKRATAELGCDYGNADSSRPSDRRAGFLTGLRDDARAVDGAGLGSVRMSARWPERVTARRARREHLCLNPFIIFATRRAYR